MNLWRAILMMGVLLPGLASAAGVYKWVDEHGNVHFGDRPQGEGAESVQIRESSPDSHNQQRVEKLIRAQEARRKQKEQDEEARQKEEAERATAERHAEYCKQVRKNLQTLKTGGRIYKPLDDGERHYFNDEEMVAEIKRLEAAIAERCE